MSPSPRASPPHSLSSHPVSAGTASTHSEPSERTFWPGLDDTSGVRAKSGAFSAQPIPDFEASCREQAA